MEKLAEYAVDKSGWGEGPWQNEPDRVDFVHCGLACLALRHPRRGHWCGYVGVPREHPAYGKSGDEVDVSFHCGLNYAKPCDGYIVCHVPRPGMSDDVWWLGGDFMHVRDLVPGQEALERSLGMPPLEFPRLMRPVYRDLPYVRHCIERLAEQLAAMA